MVAKAVVTIDHISRGRAILGLGGAWHEREHAAFGVEFGGGFGDRLDWLDEALDVIRPLLRGEVVSHRGPHYSTERLALIPAPVQAHLPIMVGGTGEKKTLRSVAKHADLWNAVVPLDLAPHKIAVLRDHCESIGRDPASIELSVECKAVIRDDPKEAHAVLLHQLERNRASPETTIDHTFWTGTVEQIAERMRAYRELGFGGFTVELPAPYDEETLVRLIDEVRPLVEQP